MYCQPLSIIVTNESPIVIDASDLEAFLVRKNADDGDIFVIDSSNEVVAIGGVAPVTGCRLVLPQENDPVTPTLAFGNGNSGFYQPADNQIITATGGTGGFIFTNSRFSSVDETPGKFFISLNTSSSIIPAYSFHGDTDTGVGRSGVDEASMIGGGVECARFKSVLNGVNYIVISPSATTDSVIVGAAGEDTNIGIKLEPKGSGVVDFSYAGLAGDSNSPSFISTPTGINGAQTTWLPIKLNGVDSYLPVWQ